MYRGISEEDSIRWVKNSFERTIREWSKEYDIESALRFETDETPPSDRVAWRHWQTYSSLELEQLANDCQWIIAAFGACVALLFSSGVHPWFLPGFFRASLPLKGVGAQKHHAAMTTTKTTKTTTTKLRSRHGAECAILVIQ